MEIVKPIHVSSWNNVEFNINTFSYKEKYVIDWLSDFIQNRIYGVQLWLVRIKEIDTRLVDAYYLQNSLRVIIKHLSFWTVLRPRQIVSLFLKLPSCYSARDMYKVPVWNEIDLKKHIFVL